MERPRQLATLTQGPAVLWSAHQEGRTAGVRQWEGLRHLEVLLEWKALLA